MTIPTDPMIQSVIDAEYRRIDALVADDMAAYGRLLATDFQLVHTNGQHSDKDGLLSYVAADFQVLGVRRENLEVRLYRDIAVMSGDMFNRIRGRERGDIVETPHRVLQIWHREGDGAWRMVAMHCTRFTP